MQRTIVMKTAEVRGRVLVNMSDVCNTSLIGLLFSAPVDFNTVVEVCFKRHHQSNTTKSPLDIVVSHKSTV